MKPDTNEQLSALMDEELSEWQLRKLLQQAENDPDVLHRWAELHEQEALRRGWPDIDILEDLNRRIDQDAGSPNRVHRPGFTGKAGALVAASAASVVVAVSALVFWPAPGPEALPGVAQPGSQALSSYWHTHAQYATYQAGQRWEEIDAALRSH